MKTIWLSAVNTTKAEVEKIRATLKQYGLGVDGHFWVDDLDKMAWAAARQSIVDGKIDSWVILAGKDDLSIPSIRYGLALLAITLQAAKGLQFPIVILNKSEAPIPAEVLPTPLLYCGIFPATGATFGAKLVAKLHKRMVVEPAPYRLDVYGIPQIGQWFEIGPHEGTWNGALFGDSEQGPCLHIVGKAGQLPEKSVLNFPQQGIEIELNGRKFMASAVQNVLDASTSYFLKVEGHPDSILFSPFTMDESAEVFVVKLK